MKRTTIAACLLLMACNGEPSTGQTSAALGTQGEQGERGLQGPQGLPGQSAIVSKAKTYNRAGLPSDLQGPHVRVTARVSCDSPDDLLITGGCATSGLDAFIQSSYPQQTTGSTITSSWACTAQTTSTDPGTVIALIVCATP